MDESKKKLLIFGGILIGIIVIGAIIALAFAKPVEVTQDTNPTEEIADEEHVETDVEDVKDDEADPTPVVTGSNVMKDTAEGQLKRIAMDFAARFGTYSTDAQNANLRQLLPSMDATLKAWAQAKIAEAPRAVTQFQSVTTRAISSKLIARTASTAEVEVSVQRENRTGSDKKITYETGRVLLVLSGGSWLVNAVTWEVRPQ